MSYTCKRASLQPLLHAMLAVQDRVCLAYLYGQTAWWGKVCCCLLCSTSSHLAGPPLRGTWSACRAWHVPYHIYTKQLIKVHTSHLTAAALAPEACLVAVVVCVLAYSRTRKFLCPCSASTALGLAPAGTCCAFKLLLSSATDLGHSLSSGIPARGLLM